MNLVRSTSNGSGCIHNPVGQLNGRIILIKGNHDNDSDEAYRQAFEDVLEEKRIDERLANSVGELGGAFLGALVDQCAPAMSCGIPTAH